MPTGRGRSAERLGTLPAPEPWGELLPRMQACRSCRLAAHRTQVVVYRGATAPHFLFVGEAPGAEEDRQGRPFVGRAGQLLEGAAGAAGLAPEEWGVTNVFMCRPPANRFDPEAARACRPWLAAKIASLHPRVLVTLGAHALASFLPEALPITTSAGSLRSWGSLPLYPMLHPASTLRAGVYRQRWEGDWRRFAELLPELRALPSGGAAPQTTLHPSPSE